MRFFYVAVAETRPEYVRAIIDTIREWDGRTRPYGIRVGVLVRYTKWRSRPCQPCKMALEHGLKVFVDNGAFSFLSAEDLEGTPDPFTLARWREDYALWLASHREEFWLAALPDIPVHGSRFLDSVERAERVRLSAENQALFLRTYGRILPKERLVPVLQGYEIYEYEESYMLLDKSGVLDETTYTVDISDYNGVLAVGSVCVRKWSAAGKTGVLAGGEAAGTLGDWLSQFLDTCCREVRGFHMFGLHREATSRFGHHARFFAADSGAHGLNFKFKWRTILGCEAPNTPECAAKAVDRQLSRTLEPLLSTPVTSYF